MDKIKDAQGLVDQLLDEAKEVKVSDVPKDKQDIFKINRAKAGIKGGKLTKAEKSGDRIKESDESLDECSCDAGKPMDQEKVAFQKDTLFDEPERMVKDKTDDEASLNPVPNTESKGISVAKVLAAREELKKKKSVKESVSPNGHGEEKRNTVAKNQRDRLSELFGFGGAVKKKRKEVQSGKYKGKSKTLTAIARRRAALRSAMGSN